MLLAARDEEGRALSDEELRDELMTLLVAGHETTATALAWTLERLARHPDVLRDVVAERRAGGEELLDATIKETLRLRPVVPNVVRQLQAPMTFGGWNLPAGVHIGPSIYLLHRRPDLYPDPLAFRPQRFLERAYGTYEWIPFGGGIRRCLGASFALFEMRVVLQTLLDRVELQPRARAGREGHAPGDHVRARARRPHRGRLDALPALRAEGFAGTRERVTRSARLRSARSSVAYRPCDRLPSASPSPWRSSGRTSGVRADRFPRRPDHAGRRPQARELNALLLPRLRNSAKTGKRGPRRP